MELKTALAKGVIRDFLTQMERLGFSREEAADLVRTAEPDKEREEA